jgi:hypothetical protein
VFFFGHGTPDDLRGESTLIDAGNVKLAHGSTVVAIACWSALGLGNQAVDRGVAAYLGFTDELWWALGHEDRYGLAASAGVRALFKGASLGEAQEATKRAFSEVVEYFKSGEGMADPNRPWACMTAQWNLEIVKVLGDVSVRI